MYKQSKGAVALTCLLVSLAGCGNTPKNIASSDSHASAVSVTTVPATVPANATPAKSSAVPPVSIPDYLNPTSPLATHRSVYFDFDDFSIKNEFTLLIEQHGKYLSSHQAVTVKIEGNADERGSSEYNLALGQKRAEAVARALKIYGVKASQLESISWGKEKPKAQGHDESAWAQNRRADIEYPTK